jgi:hypothetical protein
VVEHREGARTGIVELQKLLFDVVRHPSPDMTRVARSSPPMAC